jgi:hypothetical protein
MESIFVQETIQCELAMIWTAPDDGGSPIIGFRIEVLGNDDEYHSLNNLCESDGESTNCLVPIGALYAQPYELRQDDAISVRAQAQNAEGWSLPSEPNSVTQMVEAPTQMEQPSLESESINQFIISWSSSAETSGHSYEVYWKQEGIFVHYAETTQSSIEV